MADPRTGAGGDVAMQNPDEAARRAKARWAALAGAGAGLTRPWLDLDVGEARQRIDPERRLGDLRDARVLCLAGGGQ